jgi:hypothetical protein
VSGHRRRLGASLLAGAAALVAAWQVGPPWGRWLAVAMLALAVALLAGSARVLHRRRHAGAFVRGALLAYAPHLIAGILILLALRAAVILTPPDEAPIASLPPAVLQRQIAADTGRLLRLCATNAAVLSSFAAEVARRPTEAQAVRTNWRTVMLQASRFADLVDTYKGFHRIDDVANPRAHAEAFALGMTAFVEAYLLAQRAADLTADRPDLRDLLDQRDPAFGVDTCGRMVRMLASDKTLLRLSAGSAYLERVRADLDPANPVLPVLDRDLAAARRVMGISAFRALRSPLRRLRLLGLPEWFQTEP